MPLVRYARTASTFFEKNGQIILITFEIEKLLNISLSNFPINLITQMSAVAPIFESPAHSEEERQGLSIHIC